jgi:hypothetical protein
MTDDLFGHLDDPAAPTPNADTLGSVVRRGRHLRARRRSLFAASGAAAAVVVVIGGFGVSRALDASAEHDTINPITGSTSAEPTKTPRRHHSGDGAVPIGPGAVPDEGGDGDGHPPASYQEPPPCDGPVVTISQDPILGGVDLDPLTSPSSSPTEPAPAPSPTGDCPSDSPSPDPSATASPTESAEVSPTDSVQPSEAVPAE